MFLIFIPFPKRLTRSTRAGQEENEKEKEKYDDEEEEEEEYEKVKEHPALCLMTKHCSAGGRARRQTRPPLWREFRLVRGSPPCGVTRDG